MKVKWFDPSKKLPEDTQECLLMPKDHGGFTTVGVFGPIMWNAKAKVWLDLFRDPEAGTIVKPEQVGKWCDWESIAPENEEDEPKGETT